MSRPELEGIRLSFDILQLVPTHPHQPCHQPPTRWEEFPPSCERDFLSTRNNENEGPRRGGPAGMRAGDGLSCPSPQNVCSYLFKKLFKS